MSRMDLLGVNGGIVREVAENVARHAPDAVVIVVSNPLDEMTTLAQVATGFPHERVMGQAGMLDTARFTYFVAEKLAVPVGAVKTLTLGSHGDTMVPVPSACTVNGQPLAQLLDAQTIEELVVRTRNGGAEVVGLLKSGSAFYAPSAAAARMARAVVEDSGAVMPVCAWVDGQYGIEAVYLGVEAELGKTGVRRVVERDLTETRARRAARGSGRRQGQGQGRRLALTRAAASPAGSTGAPGADGADGCRRGVGGRRVAEVRLEVAHEVGLVAVAELGREADQPRRRAAARRPRGPAQRPRGAGSAGRPRSGDTPASAPRTGAAGCGR